MKRSPWTRAASARARTGRRALILRGRSVPPAGTNPVSRPVVSVAAGSVPGAEGSLVATAEQEAGATAPPARVGRFRVSRNQSG